MKENTQDIWTILTQTHVIELAAALLILVAGWLIALTVKKFVVRVFERTGITKKLALLLPEDEAGKTSAVGKFAANLAFWLLFLLAVLACFSALGLNAAAGPIHSILDKFGAYLPNLVAAALLIFAAWLVASALQYLTLTMLSAIRVDEKIEERCDTGGRECNLSFTLAHAVYALTWLFFLPAVLDALKIGGVNEQIKSMLGTVLGYLPNLAGAAAILFGGWLLAGFLRKLVLNLLAAAPQKYFGDTSKYAKSIGAAVYALAAVPAAAAALGALRIGVLADSAGNLFAQILSAAGRIFGALALIFAAWIVGLFAAKAVRELLTQAGFNRIFRALKWEKEDAPETETPAVCVEKIILAAVIVFASVGAFEMLGFDRMAGLIQSFVPFAAKILLAAAVFLFGVWLANYAAAFLRTKECGSEFIRTAVRVAILFFAGALALHATGIADAIVLTAFALILGAFALAAALAFGLGGRDTAAKKLAEWTEKKDENKK